MGAVRRPLLPYTSAAVGNDLNEGCEWVKGYQGLGVAFAKTSLLLLSASGNRSIADRIQTGSEPQNERCTVPDFQEIDASNLAAFLHALCRTS